MLKGLIPSALVLSLISLRALAADHYLLLPDTLPTLSRLVQPAELEFTDEGVTLLKVERSKIEAFSENVHKELGACGGFIDVTSEIDSGKSGPQIVWEYISKRNLPQRKDFAKVSYRTDVANLVAHAEADSWLNFLNTLTAFPDRSADTELGVKAAEHLRTTAEALGLNLRGFSTRIVKTGIYYEQPSVVATLQGSRPELGSVVIGGHMDTFADQKPGADDDGSGSATVLEVLRSIAISKATFERTIHFIWYAAEERGLVGSSHVVKDFIKNKIGVEGIIQFDMTGYKSPMDDKDVYVIMDYTNKALSTTLKDLITTYTKATVGETRCGYACSDHVSWHRESIPAVFPFESAFENMNQRLHTKDDTVAFLDKNHALFYAQAGLAFLGHVAKLEGFLTEE